MCKDGPDRTGLPDTPRLAFADQPPGQGAATRPTTDFRTGDAGGRPGVTGSSTQYRI